MEIKDDNKKVEKAKDLNTSMIINSIIEGIHDQKWLPEEIMMTIQKKCKYCEYEWEYNGQSPYYCTCPMCRKTQKL